MSLFTPITGALGGSLIGLSASTLLLFNGDILGASGITTSSVLHPSKTRKAGPWKYVFLAVFCTAANLWSQYTDEPSRDTSNAPSALAYAIGGLLVGFGTKLGNGCTSGHGICGLARFSKRSFAAVCAFMTTGIVTSVLISPYNTLFGTYTACLRDSSPAIVSATHGKVLTVASIVAALPSLANPKSLGAALSGALFAVGLAISGMTYSEKIQNFLDVSALWTSDRVYDPTLMTVMGAGATISWISYQFLPKFSFRKKGMACPLKSDEFHVPTYTVIDWKLLGGEACFGVGWALGALCPGPALFLCATGVRNVLWLWLPGFFGGAYAAERLVSYTSKKKSN